MSRTAPAEQPSSKPFYDLVGFARLFIQTHSITCHQDVRTEALAEAFRHHMGLPAFPTLRELFDLCRRLEIELDELPTGSTAPGANTSYGRKHAIFVRGDLPIHFTESTVGHELREVIERALQQAAPWYRGLDTSDNQRMHGESEFFALCLLMQAEATHQRLAEIGFDFVRFSNEKRRSLPSVIMRARTIYSGTSEWDGPRGGLWLFDAPAKGPRTAADFRVKHDASLNGFSRDKRGSELAKRANVAFPARGDSAESVAVVRKTLETRRACQDEVSLLDLFGDEAYTTFCEPITMRGEVRRVMMAAVREDFLRPINPWRRRLGLVATTSS